MASSGGAEDALTAGGDAFGDAWDGAGSEKSSRSIIGVAATVGVGAPAAAPAAAAADFTPVPAFWRGGTVLVVAEAEEEERPVAVLEDVGVVDDADADRSFSLVRLELFFEEDLESPSPPFLLAGVCDKRVGGGEDAIVLKGLLVTHAIRREGCVCSFVGCLSHLTIGHASLSRRSTVPTLKIDISNIWALITLFPFITYKLFAYPCPSCFRRDGGREEERGVGRDASQQTNSQEREYEEGGRETQKSSQALKLPSKHPSKHTSNQSTEHPQPIDQLIDDFRPPPPQTPYLDREGSSSVFFCGDRAARGAVETKRLCSYLSRIHFSLSRTVACSRGTGYPAGTSASKCSFARAFPISSIPCPRGRQQGRQQGR